MLCELPTLLVLGEYEGRTVDRGDEHPAGMVWLLSSQVTGRVAAESKGSQPTLFLPLLSGLRVELEVSSLSSHCHPHI